MLQEKGCPVCGGDIYDDSDSCCGPRQACLQCGRTIIDPNQPKPALLAKPDSRRVCPGGRGKRKAH